MRFVIISLRRSGSSHFVSTIIGHPEIMCHGNIFVSGMLPVYWPKDHPLPSHEIALIRTGLRELRKADPRAFLERVFATDHGRAHVGFKTFARQNDEILDELIDDPSVRKLVLIRGNILARFSSQLIAHDTGSWGVRTKLEVETPKVEFNPARFTRYRKAHTDFYARIIGRLLERRQNYHLIRYEEINDSLMLRSAINFIGANPDLPIVEPDGREAHVKQNSSDIISRFSNADVVRGYLAENNLGGWEYEGESHMSAPVAERPATGEQAEEPDREGDSAQNRDGEASGAGNEGDLPFTESTQELSAS